MKVDSLTVEDSQVFEKKIVIEILQQSSYALSVKDIRTAVWTKTQRKLPDYYLSRLLRTLASEGLVSFRKGRWSFPSNKSNNEAASRYSSGVDYPVLSALGLDALGSVTKRSFDTSATSILTQGVVKPLNLSKDVFEGSGPWSKFRNLIAYYKECIRNEEGAEASSFVNEYGNRYLYFSQIGEWYPKADRPWIYTVPLGSHLTGFVKELEKAGDSAVVVLGYPLQGVYIKKENEPEIAIIRPVFQYLLKINFSHGGLTFSTVNSRPEICLDWLKYAFSSYSQQRHFLSACGLINSSKDNDEVEDYDQGHGIPDLGTLATTLSTFLSKKIREPLLVDEISTAPLKTPFESGVYNKAVIMIGSRTKFTKSLLSELTTIENADDSVLDTTSLQYIFRDGSHENAEPVTEEKSHESCVIDTGYRSTRYRKKPGSL